MKSRASGRTCLLGALALCLGLGPLPVAGQERPVAVQSRGDTAAPLQGATQRIVLDRSIPAPPWVLFPAVPKLRDAEPTDYYAVPNELSFVEVDGKPVFSFMRFVQNSASGGRATGGGILVASLQLGPPADQVERSLQKAEEMLRERNPQGKVVGTAMFSDGVFRVISTVKPAEGADAARPGAAPVSRVLGEGRAPVVPGGRVAVHMKLSEQDMLVMWESFKMHAKDLSLEFDMNLRGYDSPISAEVFGSWDQIYEHESFKASVGMPILKFDIDKAVTAMHASKALRIVGVGEGDEKFNKVLDEVTKTIRDAVFSPMALAADAGRQAQTGTRDVAPVEPKKETAPGKDATADKAKTDPAVDQSKAATDKGKTDPATDKGKTDAATDKGKTAATADKGKTADTGKSTGAAGADKSKTVTGSQDGAGKSSTASGDDPGFRLEAKFVMREERQTGDLYFSFDKYRPTTIPFPIRYTLAGLDEYRDDDTMFRTTNLDDTFLQQREISVMLDGALPGDFADYINFVNVQLRKTHQSGEITDREVTIDRKNFNQDPNQFRMVYGWRGDVDRTLWQDYEWRPIWSFFGGTQVAEDWRAESASTLSVRPPFDRTTVQLSVLDPGVFEQRGVRAAVVDVFYPLGDQEKSVRALVKRGDQPMDRTLDLIRPRGESKYSYQVVFLLAGGKNADTGRRETTVPLLFLDDILETVAPPEN